MSGDRPGRLRHAEPVMGTVVSFDVPDWVGPTLAEAVRWLHWVDATFSPYRDDSDVSRFGRGSLDRSLRDACARRARRSARNH